MDLEVVDIKIEVEPQSSSNMESILNYNPFSPELAMNELDLDLDLDPLRAGGYDGDDDDDDRDLSPSCLIAKQPTTSNKQRAVEKKTKPKTKTSSKSKEDAGDEVATVAAVNPPPIAQIMNNNLVNRNTPVVVIGPGRSFGAGVEAGATKASASGNASSCPRPIFTVGYDANGSNAHWMIQVLNINKLPFLSSIGGICDFAHFCNEIRQITQDEFRFEFNTTLTCEDHPHPPLDVMRKLKAVFENHNLYSSSDQSSYQSPYLASSSRDYRPVIPRSRCPQILWTR